MLISMMSMMSRRVEALLAQVMLWIGEMTERSRTSVSVSEAVRFLPRRCGIFRAWKCGILVVSRILRHSRAAGVNVKMKPTCIRWNRRKRLWRVGIWRLCELMRRESTIAAVAISCLQL
jgi:hypothetical protein